MRSLLQILESRAAGVPEKIALTFFNEPPCTFSHLWRQINRCARFLLRSGLQSQQPVVVTIGNSPQFFYAFYGVQRGGGIAVPIFPGSGPERMIKLANLCGAAVIMISRTHPPASVQLLKQQAAERGLKILLVEDAVGADGRQDSRLPLPDISPRDTAFVQFTSGSTGSPRGVVISQANIITNLEQMIAGMEITGRDVFVSWLPVYHDMGLILMTMVPFYLGIDLVLLPTGLNHLKSWLQTIGQRRATFTAAPDFAYRLCLIYIRDPEHYDLSSLRVALNAAEPVRATTIRRFEERFRLQNVMLPAYGLAEATVGVCSHKAGEKIKVDRRGFVSVGRPFPGIRMRISGGNKTDRPADTGQVGEIWVKSPANTAGYYRNPAATKELFTNEGYIHTGDLGYRDAEGDYYIVGRRKNIIIQGGYNIAAREVEEWVDTLDFVRRSAAVGIDRGGAEGEQVYIFIEVKVNRSQLQEEETFTAITIEVVGQFKQTFGFPPGRVYLLKPRAIPLTANGKIKYPQLKEHYLDGSLRANDLILFPPY
jgi:acyl-CoA synthetase (AMP-forming)/AMP-acid ligase II